MKPPCPFCGAPHIIIEGVFDHWTCGTRTGAKGHPSLYSRGERCRVAAMTTPDQEAVEDVHGNPHGPVEAAMKIARPSYPIPVRVIAALAPYARFYAEPPVYAAARILADEVERLRGADKNI